MENEDSVNPELTVTVDRAVTTLRAIGKEHCNVTYLVLYLSLFLFFFPPPSPNPTFFDHDGRQQEF